MTLAFDSVVEFLHMGAHGVYVWSAWGIAVFFILSLIQISRLERKKLIIQVKKHVQKSKHHHLNNNS